MIVYVIMSNDYPDSVFSNEETAKAFVELRNKQEKENKSIYMRPSIYWKAYKFEVRDAL